MALELDFISRNYFVTITQTDMNTDTELRLKGTWNEIKGKAKQHYSELTEDDLSFEEGQEEEFFGNLQRKLGKSISEIKAELNKL